MVVLNYQGLINFERPINLMGDNGQLSGNYLMVEPSLLLSRYYFIQINSLMACANGLAKSFQSTMITSLNKICW